MRNLTRRKQFIVDQLQFKYITVYMTVARLIWSVCNHVKNIFDICFRFRQSADHLLFRLQNGDLTCYELKEPEWHSVAVYSVYSTVQLVDWLGPGIAYTNTCTSCYNSWRSTNSCLDKLPVNSVRLHIIGEYLVKQTK